MELIALWKFFWRRWWLILLPPIVVLVLIAPDLLRPPSGGWTTTINLTAAQPPGGDEPTYEDSSFVPWTASEYLVNALADWVRTGSFAQEVSHTLAGQGLTIDPGALRASVGADNTRSVLQVFFSWPDSQQLEAIAQAAITVLQTRSQAYFPQLSAEPAQVIALDNVALAPVAPSLLDRLKPLVKVVLALLAGLGLAALVEYLDDTVYSGTDLEALDLAVIGTIPRHRGQKF